MRGRRRRQIVEDKAVSLECNPILHVPASFPRTGGSGRSVGGCLLGGEAVAATCFNRQEASGGVGLLGHDK